MVSLGRVRRFFGRAKKTPVRSPRRSPGKSPRRSPGRSLSAASSVYYNAAESLNNMIKKGYIKMPKQPRPTNASLNRMLQMALAQRR
jgi:hypothetical protein